MYMGKKSSNNAAKLRDYLFNLNILPKSQMPAFLVGQKEH